MSTRKKQRRFRGKPTDLTLDELGMLTHIRTHLVGGKFQHTNRSTAAIFGCNESTISRLISRLEGKEKIHVDRAQDDRGVWMTQIITPKSPHAQVHEAECACYQDVEEKSAASTCTGASHTALQNSRTPDLKGSYIEDSLISHAQVHEALVAARQQLQKMKDRRTGNFDRKAENYHAKQVHAAQQEVRRLERLQAGLAGRSRATGGTL